MVVKRQSSTNLTQNVREISEWKTARTWIAIVVVGLSILGALILSAVMIFNAGTPEQKAETAQQVLLSVLPLLGTWVGTVLAFYFSKDTFESATRSTRELLGINHKLASIAAEEVMINKAEILSINEDDDSKIVIVQCLEQIRLSKKGQRLPVFNSNMTARYVVHRSIFNDFLTTQALAGKTKNDLEKLALNDLVASDKGAEKIIKNFGTVKPSDTLDKVKTVMESLDNRQDVFVTSNGKLNGEVIGWITNGILDEHSVV